MTRAELAVGVKRVLRWLLARPSLLCDHAWRPCVVELHSGRPWLVAGRRCRHCDLWQPLDEWEFFSQFGESFHAIALRETARGKNHTPKPS